MNVTCQACGWTGPKPTYGCLRVGLVILLGFFMIIPGILYALYAESQIKSCPRCGQKRLIPA